MADGGSAVPHLPFIILLFIIFSFQITGLIDRLISSATNTTQPNFWSSHPISYRLNSLMQFSVVSG